LLPSLAAEAVRAVGESTGGARARRPVRASRLQARIALTPDHRASSYAHKLGSQERKLGHIERVPNVRGWGAGLAALGPRRVPRPTRATPILRPGTLAASRDGPAHSSRNGALSTCRGKGRQRSSTIVDGSSRGGFLRAGGSTSTRATSRLGAGPGRVTGQGAARLSPSPRPRGESSHPGGLARPAPPPQPLERRERALVQRLERPRRLAAEQALWSAVRGPRSTPWCWPWRRASPPTWA
jgi:hypothetical protein